MILVAATAVLLAVLRGPAWLGMLWIWFVHAAIGAVLSAPIAFCGRERARWCLCDLLAFILPFAAWCSLMNASSVGKSLANLGEAFLFSFAIPVAALIRVIAGPRVDARALSIGLVALLCVVAACVYWWTPALPE